MAALHTKGFVQSLNAAVDEMHGIIYVKLPD